ncbi:MAG: OmpA family protein [Deltaproteobacteria bacterium]|nr:OmpA family protein [Deltaproteobacteria bacterium]
MVWYRSILPLLVLFAILAAGGTALAADGYDGLVLKPQMVTRGAAATMGATVPGYLDVEGGMFLDVMGPSLKLVQNGGEEQIVGTALTVNVMSAVGLWYGTEAGLVVPIVPFRAVSDKYGLNSAAIGDIALNLKYQILGHAPDDWKLGAGPVLFFPTGSLEQLTGAGNFAFALIVAGEKSFGPVTAIANLGYHYRPTATYLKTETGMTIPVRAAVEYWVLPASLAVLGEVNSAIGLKGGTPAEGYLEAKYNLGFAPLTLLAGGGAGFTSALGVPPWRAFASAVYTFKNEPAPAAPPGEVKMEPPKWMMKDADNDGVPDDVDKCPEAAGPSEAHGCPPGAPAAPAPAQPAPGVSVQPAPAAPPPPAKPAVDDSLPALGIPDKDKDGIPNDKDECQELAGPEWNKGCPVKFDKKVLSFNTIVFGKNNADILPDSFKVLDAVVQALRDSPKVKVRIEGHTDNVGDSGRNITLSNERALNVMSYLIAKGLDPARLSYIGYGGSQPASALKTEEGRRQNRRIDFRVME